VPNGERVEGRKSPERNPILQQDVQYREGGTGYTGGDDAVQIPEALSLVMKLVSSVQSLVEPTVSCATVMTLCGCICYLVVRSCQGEGQGGIETSSCQPSLDGVSSVTNP
jgi:hypothetical protein